MSKNARRRSRRLGLKKGFRREAGATPRHRVRPLREPAPEAADSPAVDRPPSTARAFPLTVSTTPRGEAVAEGAGSLQGRTPIGISALFLPDELECLARTAADAVYGDADDLSQRQWEMAARVRALMDHEAHGGDVPTVDVAAALPIAMRTLVEAGYVGVSLFGDGFEITGPDDISLYDSRCRFTSVAALAACLGIRADAVHDARPVDPPDPPPMIDT